MDFNGPVSSSMPTVPASGLGSYAIGLWPLVFPELQDPLDTQYTVTTLSAPEPENSLYVHLVLGEPEEFLFALTVMTH